MNATCSTAPLAATVPMAAAVPLAATVPLAANVRLAANVQLAGNVPLAATVASAVLLAAAVMFPRLGPAHAESLPRPEPGVLAVPAVAGSAAVAVPAEAGAAEPRGGGRTDTHGYAYLGKQQAILQQLDRAPRFRIDGQRVAGVGSRRLEGPARPRVRGKAAGDPRAPPVPRAATTDHWPRVSATGPENWSHYRDSDLDKR